jgi:hypothetical protein
VGRHCATRRTLIVVAATLLVLALAASGSLALVDALSETPQQFIGDATQPLNARTVIEQYLSQQRDTGFNLTGVQRVVTADTPDGEYGVYALTFTDGVIGTAVISSATGGIAGITFGPPVTCPAGWALQAGSSMVETPGTTPLYLTGRAARSVTAIDVVYPDGHSTAAAVSNGYFLAWVIPLPGAPNARSGFSPPVTLVAHDPGGNEIGRLSVRADGDIPPAPGQSPEAPACG